MISYERVKDAQRQLQQLLESEAPGEPWSVTIAYHQGRDPSLCVLSSSSLVMAITPEQLDDVTIEVLSAQEADAQAVGLQDLSLQKLADEAPDLPHDVSVQQLMTDQSHEADEQRWLSAPARQAAAGVIESGLQEARDGVIGSLSAEALATMALRAAMQATR